MAKRAYSFYFSYMRLGFVLFLFLRENGEWFSGIWGFFGLFFVWWYLWIFGKAPDKTLFKSLST